jgi:hypothetical protein
LTILTARLSRDSAAVPNGRFNCGPPGRTRKWGSRPSRAQPTASPPSERLVRPSGRTATRNGVSGEPPETAGEPPALPTHVLSGHGDGSRTAGPLARPALTFTRASGAVAAALPPRQSPDHATRTSMVGVRSLGARIPGNRRHKRGTCRPSRPAAALCGKGSVLTIDNHRLGISPSFDHDRGFLSRYET